MALATCLLMHPGPDSALGGPSSRFALYNPHQKGSYAASRRWVPPWGPMEGGMYTWVFARLSEK
eukprot:179653-Pelagomonas_calceolata.AAC.1